jgi:thiamine kinase-like enzyme
MFKRIYLLFKFYFLFGFCYILQFIDKYIINLTSKNIQIKYINELIKSIKSIMGSNDDITFIKQSIGDIGDKNDYIRVFKCNNKKYIIKYNNNKKHIFTNALDAAINNCVNKECEFNNIAKNIDIPINIPKIIFSEYNGFLWKFVCIFEYIEDYKQISQIESIDFKNAELCIKTIAKLHKTYSQNIESLKKYKWLINADTKNSNIIDWLHFFDNRYDKDYLNFINILSKYINKIPSTLIHGDFRSGNMLFKENVEPYLLDWELVKYGLNLFDLVYFIIFNLNNTERQKYEKELIKLYAEKIDYNNYAPGRCINDDYIITKVVVGCILFHINTIEMIEAYNIEKKMYDVLVNRFKSMGGELDAQNIARILGCDYNFIAKNLYFLNTSTSLI